MKYWTLWNTPYCEMIGFEGDEAKYLMHKCLKSLHINIFYYFKIIIDQDTKKFWRTRMFIYIYVCVCTYLYWEHVYVFSICYPFLSIVIIVQNLQLSCSFSNHYSIPPFIIECGYWFTLLRYKVTRNGSISYGVEVFLRFPYFFFFF